MQSRQVRVESSGWLAACIIECRTKNELGQELFAHTSPIYVEVDGKPPFDVEAARAMLQELEASQAAILLQGKFSSPEAAARLLGSYQDGVNDLRNQIKQRAK